MYKRQEGILRRVKMNIHQARYNQMSSIILQWNFLILLRKFLKYPPASSLFDDQISVLAGLKAGFRAGIYNIALQYSVHMLCLLSEWGNPPPSGGSPTSPQLWALSAAVLSGNVSSIEAVS